MIELSVIIGPIISAVVTAIITGVSIYVAMSNRLSILETKMDVLSEEVREHNGVVKRMYKAEADIQHIESEIHHYHP